MKRCYDLVKDLILHKDIIGIRECYTIMRFLDMIIMYMV